MPRLSERITDYRSGAEYDRDPVYNQRIERMSAEWRGTYRNAGRGIGQYAIDLHLAQRRGARLHAALGSALRGGFALLSLLALTGFVWGLQDAYVQQDGAMMAEEKVFFYLNDFIANGLHALASRIFTSPDMLGLTDAVTSATAIGVATLVAKFAACGATVFATAGHLLHMA